MNNMVVAGLGSHWSETHMWIESLNPHSLTTDTYCFRKSPLNSYLFSRHDMMT